MLAVGAGKVTRDKHVSLLFAATTAVYHPELLEWSSAPGFEASNPKKILAGRFEDPAPPYNTFQPST